MKVTFGCRCPNALGKTALASRTTLMNPNRMRYCYKQFSASTFGQAEMSRVLGELLAIRNPKHSALKPAAARRWSRLISVRCCRTRCSGRMPPLDRIIRRASWPNCAAATRATWRSGARRSGCTYIGGCCCHQSCRHARKHRRHGAAASKAIHQHVGEVRRGLANDHMAVHGCIESWLTMVRVQ